LLEWRRTPTGGWEGRVAYVPHLENGHALVEPWLSANICTQPIRQAASLCVAALLVLTVALLALTTGADHNQGQEQ
jgi:hypothetical protein